ncbi:unnamed protein product [Vitrella brassicaformis CCMP3155]|uniref:Uncharacterized protein n=1 Tax=Vitrella brassicaformis (strain CCMP3155) TaxID=1169540 RepID=A0A0G4GS91_VITBC|nr:unnamed protein product [Vitrella brassicaformis CCMP3155]|eukprot:CEM33483.1 unnamed protein product [Vitrella brassicaformis CCMP3155]
MSLSENEQLVTKFGGPFINCIGMVDKYLRQVLLPRGSGKRWEGVTKAAVLLRLLDSHTMAMDGSQSPTSLLTGTPADLLPPPVISTRGCPFGGIVRVPVQDAKDLPQLIECFNRYGVRKEMNEGYVSYLLDPGNPQFQGWDSFVFVTKDGELRQIWGYQNKEADQGPEDRKPTIERALEALGNEGLLDGLEIHTVWLQGDAPTSFATPTAAAKQAARQDKTKRITSRARRCTILLSRL